MTLKEVEYHLIVNVFLKTEVWNLHGKRNRKSKEKASSIKWRPFNVNLLLQNVSGKNNNYVRVGDSNKFEEPPNSNTSTFYNDVIDEGAHIYSSNTSWSWT